MKVGSTNIALKSLSMNVHVCFNVMMSLSRSENFVSASKLCCTSIISFKALSTWVLTMVMSQAALLLIVVQVYWPPGLLLQARVSYTGMGYPSLLIVVFSRDGWPMHGTSACVCSDPSKLTLCTRNRALSSILMFSLAEVSNQPMNPFSLQKSSIWLELLTRPSLAWSHCQK